MKTHVLLTIAVVLGISTAGYADRAMTKTESLAILQKLSATPTTTWIPAGTIIATHQEYKAAKTTDSAAVDAMIQQKIADYQANPNKIELTPAMQKMALEAIPFNVRYDMSNVYTMNSNVTVKYDGSRFYWSIKVTSRTDSVSVTPDLANNYATRQFKMDWSGDRIFAWDGQKYTLHMNSPKPALNQAMVDAAGIVPRGVNGPLTAGVIPWGSGSLSTDSLNKAAITANEVTLSGQTQVQMMVQPPDGSIMNFTFDPAKDYAVTAFTWRGKYSWTLSNRYSDYKKIGTKWVPMTIVLERHDFETNRLLKSDTWNFTQVDPTAPHDFSVPLNGAQIEHYSPVSTQPAVYTYTNTVNVDNLLAQQIAFNVARNASPQNCATAALKYVAGSFGKSVSDKDLSNLVRSDGKTTLESLRLTSQGLGIHARAVKIDLDALRTLGNCKAILHIPGKNHFVVLDSIDGPDAWLVDLSSDKFYYRTSADLLPLDWSDGVALLLSAQPIKGTFHDLSAPSLNTVIGGYGGYSCTDKYNDREIVYCDQPDPAYGCDGLFFIYASRYGCEEADTGTCTTQQMVWFITCVCLPDEVEPLACYPDYEWEPHYVDACK